MCTRALCLVLCSATAAFGQGTVVWDESINGPLSNDGSNPTILPAFLKGSNSIIGSVEVERSGAVWIGHDDFFTFQIPVGWSLAGVYLTVDKANVWAWVGDETFSTEVGFAQNAASGDLLPQWGIISLNQGLYGMYLSNHDHQSDLSIASYRLDFLTQSVPEPGAVSVFLAGAGVAGFLCWKKCRLNNPPLQSEVQIQRWMNRLTNVDQCGVNAKAAVRPIDSTFCERKT